MHQVHAGGLLEDLGGQVRGAARAGTGERVLARFRARQRHQFGDVLGRQPGGHDQYEGQV
ncbi:hypothetical protein D3C71_1897060 [compost metagenome]